MEELLIKIFLFSLLLFFSNYARARIIDHINIQYAGEIGTMAIGGGHIFNSLYELELFYGIVPSGQSGTDTINTIALKNNFNIYKISSFRFYLGASIYYVLDDKYSPERKLSDNPREYSRSSIRYYYYYVIDLMVRLNHRIYFENGINDIWLLNYFGNKDSLDINDHMSMALGYRYIF